MPTREPLARSVDSVNASVDSTEKKFELKQEDIDLYEKEAVVYSKFTFKKIVNFVFNKSTQEIRRTRLSRLIFTRRRCREKEQTQKTGLKKDFGLK